MAIHAKSNGLLIGGKVLEENSDKWVFQAMDNKRPTVIKKDDAKNQVFIGVNAVDDAVAWQDAVNPKLSSKK